MHDPTEGGLATGLYELARCSNVGITVQLEKVHIFPECLELCREFGIDPMGVIASGGLLIVAHPSRSGQIADAINDDGIRCSIMGQVVEKEKGVIIKERDKETSLPIFNNDEITKIF